MGDGVRVSLTFDTTEEALAEALGGDYWPGRADGVTVEGPAVRLIADHNPAAGWIRWRITGERTER